jgi:hypothetical protein
MFKSKMLLAAFAAVITTQASWAQSTGLIFSSLDKKPEILELEKINGWSGSSIKYVSEHPKTIISTSFNSPGTQDFQMRVLNSNLTKMDCDAKFEIKLDQKKVQYIEIQSINVCINADGVVIADSFGTSKKLSPAEIAASVKKIKAAKALSESVICPDPSELGTLEEQMAKLKRVKYSCDIVDLVSGQAMIGAGTNVYVDHISGKADVTTVAGGPPFGESISVSLSKEGSSTRFSGKSKNESVSFDLSSGKGILTRKNSWQGRETVQVFSCDVAKP